MSERSSKRSRGSSLQDDDKTPETHEAKLRRQQMLNKAAQQRYRCARGGRRGPQKQQRQTAATTAWHARMAKSESEPSWLAAGGREAAGGAGAARPRGTPYIKPFCAAP
jgi:hypothetical protein